MNQHESANYGVRYAVCEGSVIEISAGTPEMIGTLTLQQLYNMLRAIHCDEHGRPLRGSEAFPDGHIFSPFRTPIWKIVRADELDAYLAENPAQKYREQRADDGRRVGRYESQSAVWFEALGRYLAAFEQMCASVVKLIRQLLRKGGVSSRGVEDILVADLAARDLVRLAKTLYNERADLDPNGRKISENIFRRAVICYESRNEIVHASWLPGGVFAFRHDDFSRARGLRYIKREKGGEAVRRLYYSAADLDFMRRQCVDTGILIDDLTAAVALDTKVSYWMGLEGGVIARALDFTRIGGGVLLERYAKVEERPPSSASTGAAEDDDVPEGSPRAVASRVGSIDDLTYELGLGHDVRPPSSLDGDASKVP
ncbi:hypothetical protein [Tahibacter soli]|uniref:Uncharacterized protein n=1 Tax=Tahibacter soli TaxID=2983605 RepID=A0A9X4BHA1_9GAMM|nr:hypothetical protein [Tahibacter soli]MDC8013875.1 hypothetical protein [Tahibacter soli]